MKATDQPVGCVGCDDAKEGAKRRSAKVARGVDKVLLDLAERRHHQQDAEWQVDVDQRDRDRKPAEQEYPHRRVDDAGLEQDGIEDAASAK